MEEVHVNRKKIVSVFSIYEYNVICLSLNATLNVCAKVSSLKNMVKVKYTLMIIKNTNCQEHIYIVMQEKGNKLDV